LSIVVAPEWVIPVNQVLTHPQTIAIHHPLRVDAEIVRLRQGTNAGLFDLSVR